MNRQPRATHECVPTGARVPDPVTGKVKVRGKYVPPKDFPEPYDWKAEHKKDHLREYGRPNGNLEQAPRRRAPKVTPPRGLR